MFFCNFVISYTWNKLNNISRKIVQPEIIYDHINFWVKLVIDKRKWNSYWCVLLKHTITNLTGTFIVDELSSAFVFNNWYVTHHFDWNTELPTITITEWTYDFVLFKQCPYNNFKPHNLLLRTLAFSFRKNEIKLQEDTSHSITDKCQRYVFRGKHRMWYFKYYEYKYI